MSTNPSTSAAVDARKRAAALKALEFIQDGAVVGLGTGSTVRHLLDALGTRVKEGLRIQGIPTSEQTADLARQFEIPLLPNEDRWEIDVAIDGADEVDPHFQLVKGGGGALLREKIVAAAAKTFVVIVDADKQVPSLGASFPVPVEVEPFGWPNTARHIERLGRTPVLRKRAGAPYVTNNHNYILDVSGEGITNPSELEVQLNRIPGVVENGLFTGMTSVLIVGAASGVTVHRPS